MAMSFVYHMVAVGRADEHMQFENCARRLVEVFPIAGQDYMYPYGDIHDGIWIYDPNTSVSLVNGQPVQRSGSLIHRDMYLNRASWNDTLGFTLVGQSDSDVRVFVGTVYVDDALRIAIRPEIHFANRRVKHRQIYNDVVRVPAEQYRAAVACERPSKILPDLWITVKAYIPHIGELLAPGMHQNNRMFFVRPAGDVAVRLSSGFELLISGSWLALHYSSDINGYILPIPRLNSDAFIEIRCRPGVDLYGGEQTVVAKWASEDMISPIVKFQNSVLGVGQRRRFDLEVLHNHPCYKITVIPKLLGAFMASEQYRLIQRLTVNVNDTILMEGDGLYFHQILPAAFQEPICKDILAYQIVFQSSPAIMPYDPAGPLEVSEAVTGINKNVVSTLNLSRIITLVLRIQLEDRPDDDFFAFEVISEAFQPVRITRTGDAYPTIIN